MGPNHGRYGTHSSRIALANIHTFSRSKESSFFDVSHIYVEAGQASDQDPHSSREDILDLLPTVKQISQVNTEFLLEPFTVTPDVLLSLTFLDMFVDQDHQHSISHALVYLQANKHSILEGSEIPPDVQDRIELYMVKLLERGINIPKKHTTWEMFFRFLADRCRWLQIYSSCINMSSQLQRVL